jgi:hypothetical protein
MTAMTAITDETARVRLQSCAAFRPDPATALPVCCDCGWLEDDHSRPAPAGAVVTELPRRSSRPVVLKAS